MPSVAPPGRTYNGAMYFLGVDGGQSGTTAVIGDADGRILGRGEAGPCNHVEFGSGREKLEAAITASIRAAAGMAKLDWPVAFASACFGMSGGPADKREILASLVQAEKIEVTDDARVALLGAMAGGPGIIVNAGTGSIACGRNAQGREMRAGGWGYIFGDEGGAFDIMRQALRAALRNEEGWGPPTQLGPMLLAVTGASTVNEVLHLFYNRDHPRDRLAGYAPLVDQIAHQGDDVARDILRQAAQHLAGLTGSVRKNLFQPAETVAVAPIGGVFQSKIVSEWFRILMELEPGAVIGPARHGPAEGALLGAYSLASLTVTLEPLPGL